MQWIQVEIIVVHEDAYFELMRSATSSEGSAAPLLPSKRMVRRLVALLLVKY